MNQDPLPRPRWHGSRHLASLWVHQQTIREMIVQGHTITAIHQAIQNHVSISYSRFRELINIYFRDALDESGHQKAKIRNELIKSAPKIPNESADVKKTNESLSGNSVNGLGHQSGGVSTAQPPTEITDTSKSAASDRPTGPITESPSNPIHNLRSSTPPLPTPRRDLFDEEGQRICRGIKEWDMAYCDYLEGLVRKGLSDEEIFKEQTGLLSMTLAKIKERYLDEVRERVNPSTNSPPAYREEWERARRDGTFFYDGKPLPIEVLIHGPTGKPEEADK